MNIITDNSKVNYNLVQENEGLRNCLLELYNICRVNSKAGQIVKEGLLIGKASNEANHIRDVPNMVDKQTGGKNEISRRNNHNYVRVA